MAAAADDGDYVENEVGEVSDSDEEKKHGNKRPRVRKLGQILADKNRTVRSAIIEQNQADKELLEIAVESKFPPKKYLSMASERSRGEWQCSTASYNIRPSAVACKHACTYCYVAPMFKRWGRECKAPAIEDLMPTDKKKVNAPWKSVIPSQRKMLFFPSTMDIFAENAADYVSTCRRIIDAGHEILFVTKPTIASITAIADGLEAAGKKYKDRVAIYITITSSDDAVLGMFEPRASKYAERVACLRLLVERGFDANIMMEPYLSDPVPLIPQLVALLPPSGTLFVGKCNYSASFRFSEDSAVDSKMRKMLNEVYSDENVLKLYETVMRYPQVFFKKETALAVLKAAAKKM